jgi:putative ABC transport system permease protein
MNYMFDIKYAWRLLIRSWGHSLLCVGVVALSVGLALWSYSIAYSQAFKPLGFPGSETWYSIEIATDAKAVARPVVDAYTYQEIQSRNTGVDYIGAFSARPMLLSEGQASSSLRGAAITPGLLAATKVKPLLGRVFDDADAAAGATAVVVLSHAAWKNYFAADANIVGREARINTQPVRVVGVMPEDFFAFQDFEVWMPLRQDSLAQPDASVPPLSPIVRLEKSASADSLKNGMNQAVKDVNKRYPDLFNPERNLQLIPAMRMMTHQLVVPVMIVVFLSMAILVLGCVNISQIFIARFLERSRELALRAALGASRARLIRQCLVETALIVMLGLIGGYGLAMVGVGWAQELGDFLARVGGIGRIANTVELRPTDLLVAVAIAVIVWLLSTLIPAWKIAHQDAAIALGGSGKGAAVRGSMKGTRVLVALQVLISCLVLVICGNLVFAVNTEVNKPNGLNIEQVLVSTSATTFDQKYNVLNDRLQYWDELEAAVKARAPGASVAFATATPTLPRSVAVAIETREGATNQGALMLPVVVVSDGYFDLLGIKTRSGRFFDRTDNTDSLPVAVVDEITASRYWPNQSAIGKRIQLSPSENGPWLTVVGIASSVAGQPYTPQIGAIYRPIRQALPNAFQLLARVPKSAGDGRTALRAAAYEVDRDLALFNLQRLDEYTTAISLSYKSMIPIFITITLITGLLAATGLFSLISRSVVQRTHEVGIRRALGASPRQSISMFLRQGWIYMGVGVFGVGIGVVATSLISKMFTNILDHIGLVTTVVFALIALVIFAASYLPARRALAMEPGDALRYE